MKDEKASAISCQERTWLSIHLCHDDRTIYGLSGDQLLLNVVPGLLQELDRVVGIDRWFFVRYGDQRSGNHIRLRISVPAASYEEGKEVLTRQIISDASRWPRLQNERVPFSPTGGFPEMDRRPLAYWERYLPELLRYGGQYAIDAAESLFAVSSQYALEVIRSSTPGSHAERMRHALLSTALATCALGDMLSDRDFTTKTLSMAHLAHIARRDGADVAAQVRRAAERQAHALRTSLLAALFSIYEGTVEGTIAEYSQAVMKTVTFLRTLADDSRLMWPGIESPSQIRAEMAIRAIVGSQTHMTNNRLGITPRDEAMIAVIVAMALDDTSLSREIHDMGNRDRR